MLRNESFSHRNSRTLVPHVPGVKLVASLLLMLRNQTVCAAHIRTRMSPPLRFDFLML